MIDFLEQIIKWLQENVLMANLMSGGSLLGVILTSVGLLKVYKRNVAFAVKDQNTHDDIVKVENKIDALASEIKKIDDISQTLTLLSAVFSEAFLNSNLSNEVKAKIANHLTDIKTAIVEPKEIIESIQKDFEEIKTEVKEEAKSVIEKLKSEV